MRQAHRGSSLGCSQRRTGLPRAGPHGCGRARDPRHLACCPTRRRSGSACALACVLLPVFSPATAHLVTLSSTASLMGSAAAAAEPSSAAPLSPAPSLPPAVARALAPPPSPGPRAPAAGPALRLRARAAPGDSHAPPPPPGSPTCAKPSPRHAPGDARACGGARSGGCGADAAAAAAALLSRRSGLGHGRSRPGCSGSSLPSTPSRTTMGAAGGSGRQGRACGPSNHLRL
jgi:translation initiation factor IF-2